MLRKISLLACIALLAIACQNDKPETETPVATEISIAEFNANPENYVGQLLAVTGTVNHVCHHGGKKMFLHGEDPDQTIKIETTDDVGPFALELEGSDVAVTGTVQVFKIDEAYLAEWEAEARAEHTEPATEGDSTEIECTADVQAISSDLAALNSTLDRINAMRQEMIDENKDYIGVYSLECTSYEEIKQ